AREPRHGPPHGGPRAPEHLSRHGRRAHRRGGLPHFIQREFRRAPWGGEYAPGAAILLRHPGRRDMPYEAFVSYSHAVDGQLAPALQSALHGLAKPWYRLRALRVFRDKTSLSANPGLWPSIERALAESEFFLLLASPEAAHSPWVER